MLIEKRLPLWQASGLQIQSKGEPIASADAGNPSRGVSGAIRPLPLNRIVHHLRTRMSQPQRGVSYQPGASDSAAPGQGSKMISSFFNAR